MRPTPSPSRPLPAATALAVLLVLPNLRALGPFCFDWDTAQLALGTVDFDLAAHQPHPPGYPLWVLASRALEQLVGTAPLAQGLLGLLTTLLALLALRVFAADRLDRRSAAGVALLLGLAAPVQLGAVAQGTYPVDLLASVLVGGLAWRGWQGAWRPVALAWPLAMLLAGFRPSGVVLLLPLLGVATWRAGRGHPGRMVMALGAAAAVGLAWFVPLTRSAGGVANWISLNMELLQATAGATSPLLGADAGTALRIAARFGVMVAAAVAPLVPWLLFSALVHFAKPGYMLLVLPPLYLHLALARPQGPGGVSARVLVAGLVIGGVLAQVPWAGRPQEGADGSRVARALAAQSPLVAVRAAAANADLAWAVARLDAAAVVCPPGFHEAAPNRRTVAYDFRGLRGAGPPLNLLYDGTEVPPGGVVVHAGPGFRLWRPASRGDAPPAKDE